MDSSFALAYLGIADCHLVSGSCEFAAPAPLFAKSAAAAESILQRGTHSVEALTTLACVKACCQRDWGAADVGFKRALDLDPGYVPAWQWYGILSLAFGKRDEGLDALRTATERDPLSLMGTTQFAVGLYLVRRYAEAKKPAVWCSKWIRTFGSLVISAA